jgi:hypothetical protein
MQHSRVERHSARDRATEFESSMRAHPAEAAAT